MFYNRPTPKYIITLKIYISTLSRGAGWEHQKSDRRQGDGRQLGEDPQSVHGQGGETSREGGVVRVQTELAPEWI